MSETWSYKVANTAATGDILILGQRGWPNSKKSPLLFPGFAQQTLLEVFGRLMRATLEEGVRISVVWWQTISKVSTGKEMNVG
jgi:hypothetical protein